MEIKIPVECYSRVVGYFRPVSNWNKGKQAEFWKRKHFSILKAFSNDLIKSQKQLEKDIDIVNDNFFDLI